MSYGDPQFVCPSRGETRKENEVAAFLKQGLELANQEATTPIWFALRLGPSTFGVFDAFRDEQGRVYAVRSCRRTCRSCGADRRQLLLTGDRLTLAVEHFAL